MSNDFFIQQALDDLGSTDSARVINALYSLRGHQDDRLTSRLIPLLRSSDPTVRRLAAEILGANKASEAVSNLIEVLDDSDDTVRVAAADALTQIGTPLALRALLDRNYGETITLGDDDMDYAYGSEIYTPGDEDTDESPLREIPDGLFTKYLDEETKEDEETLRGFPPPAPTFTPPIPETSTPPAPVQFSSYAPREAAPNVWQPLRAYVYKSSAAAAVAADAARELGESLPSFRQVSRPAQSGIAEGALIRATPELDGFQFNPPSAQIAFYDDWQRFDFKLRAVSAPLDQAVNGRISFTVEGVIVADVPLAVYVGASAVADTPAAVTRPIYLSIFCSYSHKDVQIVERVERAYKALGMTFLRDVVSLKSGQNWSVELLRLIDQADIFQLFWSPAAAESQHVRAEWLHALGKRDQGFIRPVFWEQPLAQPPPELAAIHFAYQPDLDEP